MSLTVHSNRTLGMALLLLAILALSAPAVLRSTVVARELPTADGHAPAPSIVVTAAAGVRSGPGDEYLILAIVQPGEQFALLGKSADGHWWRIDFGGQPGWLPSAATRAQTSALVSTVRVGGALQ